MKLERDLIYTNSIQVRVTDSMRKELENIYNEGIKISDFVREAIQEKIDRTYL